MNHLFNQTNEAETFRHPFLQPPGKRTRGRIIVNPKTAALGSQIERYSRSNHHLLLTGERGTGKTTIARQIHERSLRRSRPFVSLNCATLKEELVEAELFGYEKGAFTGANQMKAGLFETASGGTVFLDEIGELSLTLQSKLLKAVEEKKVRRVGGRVEIPVDLRIIAATSRNLQSMTLRHEFRPDLFDRLNILSLKTVPLREQREKIEELVMSGLETERIALGRKASFQIDRAAIMLLERYSWNGNFRELNNFVVKLAIEHVETEIIKTRDVAELLAAKERIIVSPNQLVLHINPEEHLDEIIERVKEEYIGFHLQDKSFRRTVQVCRISMHIIRRIAKKFDIIDQST